MSIIHFRSSREYDKKYTWSDKRKIGRSVEYSTLYEYSPEDDARDIAWWRSTLGSDIYKKSHDTHTGIQVYIHWVYHDSWSYRSIDIDDGKNTWYELLHRYSKKWEKYWGYRYRDGSYSESIPKIIEKLIGDQIKNTLIIIVTSSIEREDYTDIWKISLQNDVLIVHLFHPHEVEKKMLWSLVSSRILWEKYFDMLDMRKKEIEKYLIWKNTRYLAVSSHEDPALVLNNFFKNNYA